MSRYPDTESEWQRQEAEDEEKDRQRAMSRARTEDEYLDAQRGIHTPAVDPWGDALRRAFTRATDARKQLDEEEKS